MILSGTITNSIFDCIKSSEPSRVQAKTAGGIFDSSTMVSSGESARLYFKIKFSIYCSHGAFSFPYANNFAEVTSLNQERSIHVFSGK